MKIKSFGNKHWVVDSTVSKLAIGYMIRIHTVNFWESVDYFGSSYLYTKERFLAGEKGQSEVHKCFAVGTGLTNEDTCEIVIFPETEQEKQDFSNICFFQFQEKNVTYMLGVFPSGEGKLLATL